MEAKNEAAADKLLITTARLEGWDACDSGSEWFAERFPSGEAQYTEVYEALHADKREDDADWLFRHVFIHDDSVCGALAPIVQVALPASQHAEVLFGSKKSAEVTLQRSWMSFDWLVREHLPTWLERSPACAEHAAALRALSPITSEQQLADAQVALDKARSAAAAANARRLVACWNACEGISTVRLERTVNNLHGRASASDKLDELHAQRDELLAALKVAEESVGDSKSLEIVRAAIAKVEGTGA